MNAPKIFWWLLCALVILGFVILWVTHVHLHVH